VLLGPHEAQPALRQETAAEGPDDVAAPLPSPAAHLLALRRAELVRRKARTSSTHSRCRSVRPKSTGAPPIRGRRCRRPA
jgi:hypothetical protein